MKVNKLLSPILAITFFAFMALSFAAIQANQDDKWIVPEAAKLTNNPVADDEEATTIGKTLYAKHCKSCHGKEGLGDGPKAAELDTPSGDFTTEEFQEQTDGALFYKTREGRDDMPSFKKKIPEKEDIWSVINYIRTLE